MSLAVKLICVLYALECCFCIAEDNPSIFSGETELPIYFTIPPYSGNATLNGKPYQIVRVIEYLVPLSGNQSEKIMQRTATPKPHVTPINFLMKVINNNSNATICMGSLIRPKMVLSSANCFPTNTTESDYTLLDIHNHAHRIASIFRGTTFGNEMALLTLAQRIEDPSIKPIPLCSRQLQIRDNIQIYLTRDNPHFLRTQIAPNAVCKQSYLNRESVFIQANMLCAQNSNVEKDCSLVIVGDPLVYEGTLCGINVYDPSCVQDAVNGNLYTDIFKTVGFIKWMDDQAKREMLEE